MREHIFKAARADGKGWTTGYYFQMPEDGRQVHCIVEIGGTAREIIPETLRAYVGKKDKNGEYVFEGDVLHFDGGEGCRADYVILWDEDLAGYIARETASNASCDSLEGFFENAEQTGLYVHYLYREMVADG